MDQKFPRTTVAGVSMPRMLIGTNWLCGWSHTTPATDKMISQRYPDPESYMPVFDAYLKYEIDAIMGPILQTPRLLAPIRLAEEKHNRKLILIDTPRFNVDDTAEARREAEATIKACADLGTTFCLIHHSCAEQLINKNKGTIDRLNDYTDMIRQHGMIPGLTAHMPDMIVYCDQNDYDIQTYVQIFILAGFLMQIEVETVANIIQHAKKPVMTIKAMAAGRLTPFVGLTFNWNVLRPEDMITVGAFTEDEVHEDVEISLAALDHRFPNMGRRGSPFMNQAVFGAGYSHQIQL